MKKTLVVFPHGLGDCISGTPAFRKYKLTHGGELHISVLKDDAKVSTGESVTPCKDLIEGLPYIDKVHPIHSNLWANHKSNWDIMDKEAQALHKELGFDKIIIIKHGRISRDNQFAVHKMFKAAHELGVTLSPEDVKTDVWISPGDFKQALSWFYGRRIDPKKTLCMFIHGKSNVLSRTLTGENIMDMWAWKENPPAFIIECDSPEPYFEDSIKLDLENPIRVNLAIMLACKYALLADSVMMHARGAYSLPMVAGFVASDYAPFHATPLHYSEYEVFITDDKRRLEYGQAMAEFKKWKATYENNG